MSKTVLHEINQLRQMTVAELEGNFEKLAALLYRPEFVEERKRRFFGHLRNRVREERAASRRKDRIARVAAA